MNWKECESRNILGNRPTDRDASSPQSTDVLDFGHEMQRVLNLQSAMASLWQQGDADEMARGLGAMLVLMDPQDAYEELLVRQMSAIHNAAMNCLAIANVPRQPELVIHANLNSANKCLRTFATLLESLNRHRGKGQQNVTVRHVHVHDGGQAIVGNVGPGGGADSKSKGQPHAIEQAVCGDDTEGFSVPELGNDERALPDARRRLHRSPARKR